MSEGVAYTERERKFRSRRRQNEHIPYLQGTLALISSIPPKTSFRVACWNVFMRPDAVNDNQSERALIIADALERDGSDVFVLQEMFSSHSEVIVRRLRSKGWIWSSGPPTSPYRLSHGGILILSRLPITSQACMSFSRSSSLSSDSLASKGVVHAGIGVGGILGSKVIHVFATHMQAGWGQEDESIRTHQCGEAVRFVQGRCSDSDPVIFCGDFNAESSSRSMAVIRSALNLSPARGTSDIATVDPENNLMVGCDGEGYDELERSAQHVCRRGCEPIACDFFLTRTVVGVDTFVSDPPCLVLSDKLYSFRGTLTRQVSDHKIIHLNVKIL